jgi:hypothetical protein
MTEPRDTPPGNVNHLNKLITGIATETGQLELRLRTTVAGVIISQLLPDGAVKGGSAMKLRLGIDGTRFTQDVDFARATTMDAFLETFRENLTTGWADFTGRLVDVAPPRPKGVPSDYIMQPFEVRLTYKTKSWCSIVLEVGHDELDDTVDPPMLMPADIVDVFRGLGLPEPAPTPVLAVHHQIAQKLHAVSGPTSERAHDLIDLQLLTAAEEPDWVVTRNICERLFVFRKAHAWPPALTVKPNWDTVYAASSEGITGVHPDVEAAVVWGNEFIAKIASAQ